MTHTTSRNEIEELMNDPQYGEDIAQGVRKHQQQQQQQQLSNTSNRQVSYTVIDRENL
jgi:hypothetical protein